MGGVEHGQALGAEGLDAVENGDPALGVDANGRFVEHEQPRIVQEAGRDVEPALHATRVLVDALARPVDQPDQLEARIHPFVPRPPGQAVEASEEAQVLATGQVGIERDLLWHVADGGPGCRGALVDCLPGDADLAAVAPKQPADHRDRRRLTGAVRAQQAVALARRDLEPHVVDRDPAPVALPQTAAHENARPRHGGHSRLS